MLWLQFIFRNITSFCAISIISTFAWVSSIFFWFVMRILKETCSGAFGIPLQWGPLVTSFLSNKVHTLLYNSKCYRNKFCTMLYYSVMYLLHFIWEKLSVLHFCTWPHSQSSFAIGTRSILVTSAYLCERSCMWIAKSGAKTISNTTFVMYHASKFLQQTDLHSIDLLVFIHFHCQCTECYFVVYFCQ